MRNTKKCRRQLLHTKELTSAVRPPSAPSPPAGILHPERFCVPDDGPWWREAAEEITFAWSPGRHPNARNPRRPDGWHGSRASRGSTSPDPRERAYDRNCTRRQLGQTVALEAPGTVRNARSLVSHLLARTIRVEADLVDQLFNSSEKRLAQRNDDVATFKPGSLVGN
jgi:hypothetical protein